MAYLYKLVLIREECSDFCLGSYCYAMFSTQYQECTASSYDKLGFKYPSPEHNLEAFRPNYKPMKLQLSVPELPTSSPYVGDNEGMARFTRREHFNVEMALKIRITTHLAKN